MLRSILLFTLPILCLACASSDFDEAAIPQDQLSAELSFKRMANHGELEPVLEEGQPIDGWQFHVASIQATSMLGSEKVTTARLRDRTGIDYKVTSVNSPEVVTKLAIGTYGFARGRVHAVERDLAAGKMNVELLLSDWTLRDH